MELQPGLLQDIAIFGGLSEDALCFVLDRASRIQVAAGEHFLKEGDMGTSLFVLESGQARVCKDAEGSAIVLRELSPGAVFGEMSLLAVRPRSATVEASEDCIAVEITNRSLFELYEADPAQFAMLAMNLGREVSRRLWEANERLFALAHGERSTSTPVSID